MSLMSMEGASEMSPMVDKPSGAGPMQVGHIDTVFRGSTKDYDTMLRIYYPADRNGPGAAPDISQAPYMTVIWFPFYGGGFDAMGPQCEHLASWGAVVVGYGVKWEDSENSGNDDDVNDLLDMLEEQNGTAGHLLFGMIDKDAYGTCGYSTGGGISLITGAQVQRVKAIQSMAAAIYNAAVDGIAPMFNGRPLLLQVGKEDTPYIEGSQRAYRKVGAPCILVEITGAAHGGPFLDYMYVAFYLYHLQGDDDYFTFLYGDGAVDEVAAGTANVSFKLDDDTFFPPKLQTTVSPTDVPMDVPVFLNVTVTGYQRQNGTDIIHGWDIDGDGRTDLRPSGGPNASYAFTAPGVREVRYHYKLGLFTLMGKVQYVNVVNVPPVAVAGDDLSVDHDASAQLDGSASWDSPSDAFRLKYRWTFSDGYTTDVTNDPRMIRSFTSVGVLTAKLTVFDPFFGEDEDTLNITVVNVAPTVTVAEAMTVEEDSNTSFDGNGSDTTSHRDGLRYKWDFGDGMGTDWGLKSGTNHVYARSGNYTATLSVRDPEGATDMALMNVTVLNLAPWGAIESPVNGSVHEKDAPVPFAATGTDTPSDVVDLLFMWDFGDGESTDWLGRRDTEVDHVYPEAGTYHVTVTVMDDDDVRASVTHTITIENTPPVVTIVRPWPSTEVNEDSTVKFYGTATDTVSDQDGLVYGWEIDGETYTGDRAEHTFEDAGVYEAVFSATDPDGGRGTLSVTVTVLNVAPEVTVTADKAAIETNGSVSFSVDVFDSDSDMGRHIVTWDFRDGSMGEGLSVDHVFLTNGTYLVTVTVVDDDGAISSATVEIAVTDPPVVPPGPGDDGPDERVDEDMTWVYAVVFGLVGLAALAGILLFLWDRKRTTEEEEHGEEEPGEEARD